MRETTHCALVLPLPRQPADGPSPPPAEALPAPADPGTCPARGLARLAALVRAEMDDPDGLIYQPVLAGRLWQAVLSGLLAATADRVGDGDDRLRDGKDQLRDSNDRLREGDDRLREGDDRLREGGDRRKPLSRPRVVKRAIDAMEAEPDRAFTATSLAAAAGASVRTLQEGFRQHVGMPPMAYLRRLRLARVHADLLAAEPGEETVASVAHRWGFAHLGRFAAAYRAVYGRAPAETLHERP